MQSEGAFIVRLVEPHTPEVTIADVIIGSLGIAGMMTVTALVLGALVGYILIRRSRHRGIEQEHPPSIQAW